MGHRKGRMGAAARREGDFAAATTLPPGSERELLLDRSSNAGAHVGRRALREAVTDPCFVPAQLDQVDYELIAARHELPEPPAVRPEEAWADVAAAYARAAEGQIAY